MQKCFFVHICWCLLASITASVICSQVQGQSLSGVENSPVNYTEGGDAVQITNNLSVAGNSLISYATVTVSNGYNAAEDTLIYQGESGIHPVFNNETGQLLLLSFPAGSTAESSEIQTALRSVFYRNKNTDNPQSNQRTISFAVYNQNNEASNTVSRNATVQNVNDPPRLRSPSNVPVVVNSLVSGVPITSDLEVLDADDAFLTGASVNITRGRFDQFDQLVFTDNNNDNILIQRVEGSNRQLVLTGRDTKENYQAALRSISIQNLFTAQGFKGNREVVMQVTDEDGEVSNQFSQYVYVLSRTAPNNVPSSTQDISVNITENQTLSFESQQFELAYTDPEQVEFDSVVILSLPEHGFLSLDGVEIDAEYLTRDRGVVRREDINKLTYVPNQDYLGLDQFEWSTDDGINPPANNSIVSISINEAPVPFSLQIPEDAVVDEDRTTTLPPILSQASASTLLTVTLSVETGQLSIVPIIQPFVNITTEGSNELSFSGSAQAVRFALSGLQYSPAADVVGNDRLGISVSSPTDQGNGVLVITIVPIDDPVVLSNIESDTLRYVENSPPLPITNELLLTDPDGATVITFATVTVLEELSESEDQLTYNLTGGVTAVLNENRLEFTGEGSLGQYQSILRSIAYQNLSDNPQTDSLTFEYQVIDENDSLSNLVSRTLLVIPVDDSTLLTTAEPELLSYVSASEAVPLYASLEISDIDSDSLTRMLVFFTAGYDANLDSILVSLPKGMVSSWNEATGQLEINGKNSLEVYQAIARSLRYQSSATAVQGNRQLTIQAFNGETPSNQLSRAIQIIENEAPVISSFSKKVAQNGARGFTLDDFLVNYSDSDNSPNPDQFSSLRIISLPVQGVLTVANDTVTQNDINESPDGFFLSTENIEQLLYRPNPDYLGEDQWAWNAFDGAELADDSAVVSLTVVPALSIALSDTIEICPGEVKELTVEVLSGESPYTFSWSCDQENCQIQSGQDESIVAVSPVETIQYIVRITSSEGLDSIQDSVVVQAIDCSDIPLEIPSAFTPNGDGINDYWELPNAGIFSSVQVAIYDRFGNSIFESSSYQNNWDGTYRGRELPAGSYYYTIVVPRELHEYTGTVTLLR